MKRIAFEPTSTEATRSGKATGISETFTLRRSRCNAFMWAISNAGPTNLGQAVGLQVSNVLRKIYTRACGGGTVSTALGGGSSLAIPLHQPRFTDSPHERFLEVY